MRIHVSDLFYLMKFYMIIAQHMANLYASLKIKKGTLVKREKDLKGVAGVGEQILDIQVIP